MAAQRTESVRSERPGQGQEREPLVPTLGLPKGGGAVRGIDEKLSTNPVTGTASLSIPLPVSASRAMTPQLAINYDSGAGNGPFGAGMSLSIGSIARRTNKSVPTYDDERDVFVLTGEDDLVPFLVEDAGTWRRDERTENGYAVRRYRPRVEKTYSRIEHWQSHDDDHWRVIAPDNTTHIFGADRESRIFDPSDPHHVFQWALSRSIDDRGNEIRYDYVRDGANHVLVTVRWGNRVVEPATNADWHFHLELAYRERSDAFSSFRSGFEVRTTKLCTSASLFHRLAPLGPTPVLVRSLAFTYDDDPALTHLGSVQLTGHDENGSLDFPPLTLGFTRTQIGTEIVVPSDEVVRTLPSGIDGVHAWVDLRGEGLAGAVFESGQGWYFQRNLGGGRLATLQPLGDMPVPSLASGLQFGDPEQRGQAALVAWSGPLAGYRYRDGDAWEPFRTFPALPTVHDDPHARLLDVDGDGLADLVITEDHALRIYPSLGANGFGPAWQAPYPTEQHGPPSFVFADREGTIFLADMSGDGLTDIVRIRCSEVSYWPNLGHGRFGERRSIAMPVGGAFDSPDMFDPRRIRLADVDGSGTTDVIYLGDDVRVYRNLAGNELAPPEVVAAAPQMDELARVAVLDFEGDGTGCLVWSSGLAADARARVRYIRLSEKVRDPDEPDDSDEPARGLRPHLLASINNNLGAETRVRYEASTRDYIADEEAGRAWATRLPFPVHVVRSTERRETFTKTRTVTHFAYHHGCYDAEEREFRGFGCVESWDADHVSELHRGSEIVIPPRRTITWSHAGVLGREATLDEQLRREWFAGLPLLDTHELVDITDADTLRDGMRALAHRPLRDEVYADDNTSLANQPYVVTHHRYRIRRLQPSQSEFPACFAVEEIETLACHTERTTSDPRIAHTLNLAFDEYGHVRESVAIAYPRAAAHVQEDEQKVLHAVLSTSEIGNLTTTSEHRLGVPLESSTWKLTPASPAAQLFTHADVRASLSTKELLGAQRELYQSDANSPLPFLDFTARALPYESYQLAFSDEQIRALRATVTEDIAKVLTDNGYVRLPLPSSTTDAWWSRSGRKQLDKGRFFRVSTITDPFGVSVSPDYDDAVLDHVIRGITDAAGNRTEVVRFDYRHLQPVELKDPNLNHSEIFLDARGAVIAMALKGKDGPTGWELDDLSRPTTSFEYDFTARPVRVQQTARVRHREDAFEITVTHLDGAGQPLVVKHSAEKGKAWTIVDDSAVEIESPTRWIASGRVIRDNKGEPIKEYEPYFSTNDRWENDPRLDAHYPSSTLVRDPLGRVIETRHEDGSFARVVFSPWEEQLWDENDNARSYPDTWTPTGAGVLVGEARTKTLDLADSPTRKRSDTLGRPIVVITDDNRGHAIETRTKLDIVGNALTVWNPLGLAVRDTLYDFQKRPYRVQGCDDGTKLVFVACDGKPIGERTAQGFRVETTHDTLRRPTEVLVTPDGATEGFVANQTTYGESDTNAVVNNLRGRPYRVLDAAGEVVHARYTAAGQPLEVSRRFFESTDANASVVGLADSNEWGPAFVSHAKYDALDRVTASHVTPDNRSQTRTYSADGKLSEVRLDGALVAKLAHEANGQRSSITYGNGIETTYEYDPITRKLIAIQSVKRTRAVIHRYEYVYDAAGNITSVDDARVKEPAHYAGRELRPRNRYRYDGLYRLVEAQGREHIDQTSRQDQRSIPEHYAPIGSSDDHSRLRMYVERYRYDDAGNILQLDHIQAPPIPTADALPDSAESIWSRRYRYEYQRWREHRMLLEAGATSAEPDGPDSNQLFSTSFEGDTGNLPRRYGYDAHGNMTSMPGLPLMQWDWREAMTVSSVLDGAAEMHYVCDAAGQRVRKTREGATERWYVGAVELYREYATGAPVTRWSVHVMDDERRILLAEEDRDGSEVRSRLYRYQLDDHLGSARAEYGGEVRIDEDDELSREDFHPYGTTAFQASKIEGRPKRYRFTGMERDSETGLSLHGVRYYSVWLGRWVSPDPAGIDGGVALYEAMRSAPSSNKDTSGLAPTVSPPGSFIGFKYRFTFRAGNDLLIYVGKFQPGNTYDLVNRWNAKHKIMKGLAQDWVLEKLDVTEIYRGKGPGVASDSKVIRSNETMEMSDYLIQTLEGAGESGVDTLNERVAAKESEMFGGEAVEGERFTATEAERANPESVRKFARDVHTRSLKSPGFSKSGGKGGTPSKGPASTNQSLGSEAFTESVFESPKVGMTGTVNTVNAVGGALGLMAYFAAAMNARTPQERAAIDNAFLGEVLYWGVVGLLSPAVAGAAGVIMFGQSIEPEKAGMPQHAPTNTKWDHLVRIPSPNRSVPFISW